MKIEVEINELYRLTSRIHELEKQIEALQRRGTELVEENRRLRINLRREEVKSGTLAEV